MPVPTPSVTSARPWHFWTGAEHRAAVRSEGAARAAQRAREPVRTAIHASHLLLVHKQHARAGWSALSRHAAARRAKLPSPAKAQRTEKTRSPHRVIGADAASRSCRRHAARAGPALRWAGPRGVQFPRGLTNGIALAPRVVLDFGINHLRGVADVAADHDGLPAGGTNIPLDTMQQIVATRRVRTRSMRQAPR